MFATKEIQKNKKSTSTRRPFTVEEDAKLLDIMIKLQFVNWEQVSAHLPGRTSRQCRERWVNYLNPSIRTDPWNEEEDTLLLQKVNELGRCWSNIGKFFNGRSENDVKNRWYSHLKYRTIENDGKFSFIKDPSESQFPDRKKRNRVKVSPQQNAFRILEQQRHRQQIVSNMIPMFLGQQTSQPQIIPMNQQYMNVNVCIPEQKPVYPNPSYSSKTLQQNQQIPPDAMNSFATPQLEIDPQIIQNDLPISLDSSEEDTQKPEFVDFWDPHLFEEAAISTDTSYLQNGLNSFSLF